jgi:uncharacterized protein (TIGR00369 family)
MDAEDVNPVFPRAAGFEELPADRLDPWRDFGRWPGQVFFPSLVGLVLEEMRADYARMRLPFRPELRQPQGLVHGGAIATLIDTVVVPAIASAYEEPRAFSTVSMNIRYLGAVRDEDCVGEGWIIRRGRSIIFCGAEVVTPEGRLVAQGDLVYKLASVRPASTPTA